MTEELFKKCKLLEIECLNKEITNYLEGFTLSNILQIAGESVLIYTKDSDIIYLSITKDSINITKYIACGIESIHLSKYLRLTHQVLEKRDNGILYREIKKGYNKHTLTSLTEDRYTFTNDTLKRLFGNIENEKLEHLLIKLYILALKKDLKDYADYHSNFKTYCDKYPWEESRNEEKVSETVKTYLNDEDISHIYTLADPTNILLRIHNLYQGIINNQNERDINAISIGFLSPDAFDLLSLRGIKDKENSLIGESKDKTSSDYLNYLRDLLVREYNYLDNFILERNELLKAIVFDETSFRFYPLEPSSVEVSINEEIIKRHL